jgi:hypothetical protein
MVYDLEVVLPSELQYESSRVHAYHSVEAEQAQQDTATCSKSQGTLPTLGQQGTSKHSDDITPRGFTLGPSK